MTIRKPRWLFRSWLWVALLSLLLAPTTGCSWSSSDSSMKSDVTSFVEDFARSALAAFLF